MRNAIAFLLVVSLAFCSACTKKHLNEDLFGEAQSADLVYYQGIDSLMSPAGGSPHGDFKLLFNAKALTALSNDGKLAIGSEFPEGSLIVKRGYSGSTLRLYAVMKKSSSRFAADGWLWAEYEADGKVTASAAKKGEQCIDCHARTPNRDHTRSFDLH
jgi:hypothetical protein